LLTPPDGVEYRLLMTAHVLMVRVPRKLAELALDNWGLGHLKDKASLIISELVTNTATLMPGTPIEVGVYLRNGWVRLEVSDVSSEIPGVPMSLSLMDEGGRGLFVADALADKFGIEPRPPEAGGGKTIWALLQYAGADDSFRRGR
jgi:anti-sigma regulatory factor (Ser/Thr protein kinase)